MASLTDLPAELLTEVVSSLLRGPSTQTIGVEGQSTSPATSTPFNRKISKSSRQAYESVSRTCKQLRELSYPYIFHTVFVKNSKASKRLFESTFIGEIRVITFKMCVQKDDVEEIQRMTGNGRVARHEVHPLNIGPILENLARFPCLESIIINFRPYPGSVPASVGLRKETFAALSKNPPGVPSGLSVHIDSQMWVRDCWPSGEWLSELQGLDLRFDSKGATWVPLFISSICKGFLQSAVNIRWLGLYSDKPPQQSPGHITDTWNISLPLNLDHHLSRIETLQLAGYFDFQGLTRFMDRVSPNLQGLEFDDYQAIPESRSAWQKFSEEVKPRHVLKKIAFTPPLTPAQNEEAHGDLESLQKKMQLLVVSTSN